MVRRNVVELMSSVHRDSGMGMGMGITGLDHFASLRTAVHRSAPPRPCGKMGKGGSVQNGMEAKMEMEVEVGMKVEVHVEVGMEVKATVQVEEEAKARTGTK